MFKWQHYRYAEFLGNSWEKKKKIKEKWKKKKKGYKG